MSRPVIDPEHAVVAVTGGARGIGRATAHAFAARGARVAIGDLDAVAAGTVAAELGPGARAYRLDVTDPESFAEFLDKAEADLGPVDVLVNNAGVMPVGPFLDESPEVSATQMNVNFWGVYHGLRLAAERMQPRGRGHIVNVTSGAGKTILPGLSVYSATKFAATALSRAVGEELRPHGITVSAVLPVAVDTQLTDGIPLYHLPRFVTRLGLIQPAEVADVIVGTLHRRPTVAGAPRWIGPLLDLAQLVPPPVLRLVRQLARAEITMGPIDRAARAEYDGRITGQLRQVP